MNEFSKKLTILIVPTGKFYSVFFFFLLHNLSCLCYQLLTPGNLRCPPVALCESKRVTSLGIARWHTVVLLSMLRIIMATANLSSWFPVSFDCSPRCDSHIHCGTHGWPKVSSHFQSCLLANTTLNRLFISLVEPDSF